MRSFIIGTAVAAVAFFILVQLLPTMFGYEGGYLTLIVIAVFTPLFIACSVPPSICVGRPQIRYTPSALVIASRSFGTRRSDWSDSSDHANDTRALSTGASVSASNTRPMIAAGPNALRAAGHDSATRVAPEGMASVTFCSL